MYMILSKANFLIQSRGTDNHNGKGHLPASERKRSI